MLYVLRTGISWRDLPEEYGSWHTIYTRYKRWSDNGVFWKLLHYLQSLKEIVMDVVFVDGSIVPSGVLYEQRINNLIFIKMSKIL